MIRFDIPLGLMLSSALLLGGGDPTPANLIKSDRWGTDALLKQDLYPTLAGIAKIQGDVIIVLTIDKAGKVAGSKALTGPPQLRTWAESLSTRLNFQLNPTDGEGPWLYFVTVQFRLPARTVTVVPTPQGEIPFEFLKQVPSQKAPS